MKQLQIVHKNTKSNNNQKEIVSNEETIVKKEKDRRESKGRVLAISRRTYRLQNSDVYYVESESCDNIYYFVKFKPDVFEWCACPDNSTRHVKCKHIFAIEFAIRMGTLKAIDKLPKEAKRYGSGAITQTKSYRDDDYDF